MDVNPINDWLVRFQLLPISEVLLAVEGLDAKTGCSNLGERKASLANRFQHLISQADSWQEENLSVDPAADYDSEGRLAGLEILDAQKRFGGKETMRRVELEGVGA